MIKEALRRALIAGMDIDRAIAYVSKSHPADEVKQVANSVDVSELLGD